MDVTTVVLDAITGARCGILGIVMEVDLPATITTRQVITIPLLHPVPCFPHTTAYQRAVNAIMVMLPLAAVVYLAISIVGTNTERLLLMIH